MIRITPSDQLWESPSNVTYPIKTSNKIIQSHVFKRFLSVMARPISHQFWTGKTVMISNIQDAANSGHRPESHGNIPPIVLRWNDMKRWNLTKKGGVVLMLMSANYGCWMMPKKQWCIVKQLSGCALLKIIFGDYTSLHIWMYSSTCHFVAFLCFHDKKLNYLCMGVPTWNFYRTAVSSSHACILCSTFWIVLVMARYNVQKYLKLKPMLTRLSRSIRHFFGTPLRGAGLRPTSHQGPHEIMCLTAHNRDIKACNLTVARELRAMNNVEQLSHNQRCKTKISADCRVEVGIKTSFTSKSLNHQFVVMFFQTFIIFDSKEI